MPLTVQEREHFRNPLRKECICVLTGDLLEITYLSPVREKRLPGRRKKVSGFSPASRLRMLRTVATVDWSRVPDSLFITLTYPDQCGQRNKSERNQDRYVFFRAMENYLERKVGALWRIEWKKRKTGKLRGVPMPHVHLIVFGVRFIPYMEIRSFWRGALHAVGPLATDVQRIKGGRVVGKYITKYCSKLPEERSLDYASYLNTEGRHWGIHRRELIPWSQRFVMTYLQPSEKRLAENAACMTFKYFTRDVDQGFSIFGQNGRRVGEEILLRHIDKGFGFD